MRFEWESLGYLNVHVSVVVVSPQYVGLSIAKATRFVGNVVIESRMAAGDINFNRCLNYLYGEIAQFTLSYWSDYAKLSLYIYRLSTCVHIGI